MNKNYQLGLLYLVHLLVSADGVVDENETTQLIKIKNTEKIPDDVFEQFRKDIVTKKERDVYQEGIDYVGKCSDEEKLRAFVNLYKMSEADGRVHVKEVRLMLYSIKMVGIEFDDVVRAAAKVPS